VPVPRAEILHVCTLAGSSWSSSVRSDESGRFRILVTRRVPHHLEVRDHEWRWPALLVPDVAPGTLDLDLRFREPRRADLVVTRPDGKAVDAFGVTLVSAAHHDTLWASGPKEFPGGELSLPLPETAFFLEVWARGHERVRLGPFDPAATGARIDCRLRELPGLSGRITAGGRPVRGAKVELRRLAGANERITLHGWVTRVNPNVEERDESAEDGTFLVTARRSGRYALVCEAPGFVAGELAPLEVDPAVGLSGLEIVLGQGGALAGTVLVPPGREAGGILVGISRHDGRARTRRTGPDGTFRFEKLMPGAWQVRRVGAEHDPTTGGTTFETSPETMSWPTDCVVEEGRTTVFDLDLRETYDVVLSGHVSIDGRPAAGWTVRVWPDAAQAHSAPLRGGVVDERGLVRIELAAPGRVRVHLRSTSGGELPLELDQVMDLGAGENPWIVDLDTGVLEGKVAAGIRLRYEWLDGGTLTCGAALVPDESGAFRLMQAPAGRGRLTLVDDGTRDKVGERLLTVTKGGTTRVELP